MLKDKQIAALQIKDKEYTVSDANGLSIRIRPNGRKVFQYRYTIQGRTRKHTYGNYPQLSLSAARAKHAQAVLQVKQGVDLNDEKLAAKQEAWSDPTIEELADEYNRRYLLKNLKRPKDPFELIQRNILPQLGKRKANSIKRKDIVWALSKIVDRGANVTANRTLGAVKGMFNYAVERGILENTPAAVITSKSIGGKEKPRDRFLLESEIKTFLEKLEKAPFSINIQLILKLLLYTGKRVGEVTQAKWGEIDFEKRIWTIPKEKSKNALEDRIHLTQTCLDCIAELKKLAGDSLWVCASPRNHEKHISYTSVDRALKRHQSFFDLNEPFIPHDLRRTVSTHMNESGILPHIVEAVLNHKLPGISATYNLAGYLKDKKLALELWESKIKEILAGENVISIKGKNQNAI